MKVTSVLVLLLTGASLLAAPPELQDLKPRGGQRGRAVLLTLMGRDLTEDAKLIADLPGAVTPLAPPKRSGQPGRELPFLVELRPDAPVGVYPIRVESSEGLSNVLLFSVGAFPEVAEEEAEQLQPEPEPLNDEPSSAQPVPVPVIINGTLLGPERDYFRFTAQPGDALVLEAEARRAGSAVDPLIELLDASGSRLAWNDDAPGIGVDARIGFTFDQGGDYFVRIRDSKYSAQEENFYRLKIGQFAYAENIYPLGWQRGGDIEVELSGGNLEQPVRVRPDLKPADPVAEFAPVRVPGEEGGLPLQLALSNQAEVLESEDGRPATTPPETFVNGRIAKPGEKDSYRLAVEPGQQWRIDLQAAKLGTSRLYSVVTIYDPKGQMLASTRDVGVSEKLSNLDISEDTGIDQFLTFDVPEKVKEVRVEIEDLLERGGPGYGYRWIARNQTGDFGLTLITQQLNIPLRGSALVEVSTDRRGYDGPIKLMIPNLPNDLMMHGGHIPDYEVPGSVRLGSTGILTITPKPGAAMRGLQLEVWGEAVIGGKLVRRRARGPGMEVFVNSERSAQLRGRGFRATANVAPWMGVDLIATVVQEQPAIVEVTSPLSLRVIPGLKYDLNWSFSGRARGVRPPERIGADRTPNVRTFNRLRKEDEGKRSGTFDVGSQLDWGPGTYDLVLTAEIEVDGREEIVYSPAVTVDVVHAYEIDPVTELTEIDRGSEAELVARLIREPPFASAVEVKPENVPLHVTCESVVVPATSNELRLPCKAGAEAAPGEYEIDLSTSATLAGEEGKEIPITQPPVKAKLRIGGKRTNARAAR